MRYVNKKYSVAVRCGVCGFSARRKRQFVKAPCPKCGTETMKVVKERVKPNRRMI